MGTGAPSGGDVEAGSPRPAGRTILIVGGIVLVVAIAVAAVVSATQAPPTFDEGSPEAVVQGYLDAMLNGDEAEAHTYLSSDLQRQCSVRDLRERVETADDTRVTLSSVTIDGDTAEVEVVITENSGDIFDGGYTYDEWFVLTRSGDGWAIDEEPWPVYFCGN